MEDNIFEFMEKLYADLKSDISSLKGDINSVKAELKVEIQSVGNQVARLENDHGKKLDALFDGYKQLAEGQEELKSQLHDLALKVDKQEERSK